MGPLRRAVQADLCSLKQKEGPCFLHCFSFDLENSVKGVNSVSIAQAMDRRRMGVMQRKKQR
jgi:hypothetical protein